VDASWNAARSPISYANALKSTMNTYQPTEAALRVSCAVCSQNEAASVHLAVCKNLPYKKRERKDYRWPLTWRRTPGRSKRKGIEPTVASCMSKLCLCCVRILYEKALGVVSTLHELREGRTIRRLPSRYSGDSYLLNGHPAQVIVLCLRPSWHSN